MEGQQEADTCSINLDTLTDISHFLKDQNAKLDEQVKESGSALATFMFKLDQLLTQTEQNE